MMNIKFLYSSFIFAVFTLTGVSVQAQESDELDLTMDLVEEGDDLDNIVEQIELPADASAQAVESSAFGLETANAAREQGREFGQARAEEARQRGEEARGQAADNADEGLSRARQNVQDNIPGGTLDNIPENVRDNIPEQVRDRIPSRSSDITDNIPRGNAAANP